VHRQQSTTNNMQTRICPSDRHHNIELQISRNNFHLKALTARDNLSRAELPKIDVLTISPTPMVLSWACLSDVSRWGRCINGGHLNLTKLYATSAAEWEYITYAAFTDQSILSCNIFSLLLHQVNVFQLSIVFHCAHVWIEAPMKETQISQVINAFPLVFQIPICHDFLSLSLTLPCSAPRIFLRSESDAVFPSNFENMCVQANIFYAKVWMHHKK